MPDRPDRPQITLLTPPNADSVLAVLVENGADEPTVGGFIASTGLIDERIRYEHLVEAGASGARNIGAQLAKGSILAFTDDDTLVDRHWLAGFYPVLNGGAVTAVGAWVIDISDRNHRRSRHTSLPGAARH